MPNYNVYETVSVWLKILLVASVLNGIVAEAACGRQRSSDSVEESGTIMIESAIVKIIDSVQIPAELQGVISDLVFREGQMVKVDQVIAKIHSGELVMRLARARIESKISVSASENDIDVRFAKKSLEVSSSRLNRSRQSNRRVPGVVSVSRIKELELESHRDQLRVEQAAKDLKVATMRVELTRLDVKLSEMALKKAAIRSPIDGMIVNVARKPGEWVEPGDTVVKVVRMDRLKIEGFVSTSQASRIHVGDRAIAYVNQEWMEDREFPGTVLFVNPEANPINAQVQVWVEVENKESMLIPGLEASLTIVCDHK